MDTFKVDPLGGDIELDFQVNLPVYVYTAFAVWNGQVLYASAKTAPATPRGVVDFTFKGSVPTPSILVCRLDCLAEEQWGDQDAEITIVVRQGARHQAFECAAVPLKVVGSSSGMKVAQARIEFPVELVG